MAWYDNFKPLAALVPGGGQLLTYWGGQEANQAQREALDQALAAQKAGTAEAQGYMDPYAQAGGRALSELANFQDYQLPGEFDGSRYNVQDYLDPSMEFQRQQMERSVAAGAAARGGLLSGAAAKELQNRGAQLAQTDYQNSFQRMQTDKTFAYNQYINRFNQVRLQNQDRLARLQGMGQMGYNANASKANLATGLGTATAQNAIGMGEARAASAMLFPQLVTQTQQQAIDLALAAGGAGMFKGMGTNGYGNPGGAMPEAELNPTIAKMQGYQSNPYQGPATFGTGGLTGFQYGGQ